MTTEVIQLTSGGGLLFGVDTLLVFFTSTFNPIETKSHTSKNGAYLKDKTGTASTSLYTTILVLC